VPFLATVHRTATTDKFDQVPKFFSTVNPEANNGSRSEIAGVLAFRVAELWD
jgi:hypothetical protein